MLRATRLELLIPLSPILSLSLSPGGREASVPALDVQRPYQSEDRQVNGRINRRAARP
jgi:hypothetical protein